MKNPVLVIKYETRKDTESLQRKGNQFHDRSILITWYNLQHDYVDTSIIKA